MTAEVVNLRAARKARARSVAEKEATANRTKFGRSKAERAAAVTEAERLTRLLDGTKRDD